MGAFSSTNCSAPRSIPNSSTIANDSSNISSAPRRLTHLRSKLFPIGRRPEAELCLSPTKRSIHAAALLRSSNPTFVRLHSLQLCRRRAEECELRCLACGDTDDCTITFLRDTRVSLSRCRCCARGERQRHALLAYRYRGAQHACSRASYVVNRCAAWRSASRHERRTAPLEGRVDRIDRSLRSRRYSISRADVAKCRIASAQARSTRFSDAAKPAIAPERSRSLRF